MKLLHIVNRLGRWKWPVVGSAVVACVIVLIIVARSSALPEIPAADVQQGEFVIDLEALGELKAVKSVSVGVPRRVRSTLRVVALAEDGSMVEEGDFLVQFDTSEAMQEVEERRNELDNARAELKSLQANIKSTMAQLLTTFETQTYSYEQAKLRYEQMKYEAKARQREQELNLKKAELALEQAEKKLESQKVINQADLTKAELKVKQAEMRLRQKQEELEELTLKAPIGGLVVLQEIWSPNGRTKIKVGDTPWRGMTLVEIPDLSQMMVKAKVNEVFISQLAEGQQVIVHVDALTDVMFYGTITRVATLATRERGSKVKTFDVEILLNGSNPRLRPGMTAQCQIITDRLADKIYIPLESVFQKQDTTIVYLANRGYEPQSVRLGARNNDFVVVEEGLSPKDKVALRDPSKPVEELGGESSSPKGNPKKKPSGNSSDEQMIIIG